MLVFYFPSSQSFLIEGLVDLKDLLYRWSMAVIFCASKHTIIAQWTKLLTCKEPYIAKSQKDLLTQLSKNPIAPVVFIEERLYADQTPALIASLRASYPQARLLVLSHTPSFHGGQAMLGFGAQGYGNLYMSKAWLNDAYMSLVEGENWLFPLQETLPKQIRKVGGIRELEGVMVDEFNQPLARGSSLQSYQKILLLEGKAVVEFENGDALLLQGREPLMIDESIFNNQPSQSIETLIIPETPKLERPFYVNIGAQSLIAPMSDELEIKPSEYMPVCPFVIEEGDSSLSFAQSIEMDDSKTIRFNGPIEAYELIHSSALGSVLVNDLAKKYEGSSVVYEPIKTLLFSNASVALEGVRPRQENIHAFGLTLSWDEVGEEWLEFANIEITGGRQGVDYVLFDRHAVPEALHFTYSLDEKSMGIYFEGRSSREDYKKLLQTLSYECSNSASSTSLHVTLKVGSKEKTYTLLNGHIDTSGNTE